MALVLVAALAALGADLWLWPPTQEPAAQTQAMPSPARPETQPSQPAPQSPTPALTPTLPVDAGSTPPPCVPPPDWTLHVVQEGNTLYSIARRYGTDVDALMRVNCLNTFTIFVDQRLYVPGTASSAEPATPYPTASPAPTRTAEPGAAQVLPTATAPSAPTTRGALQVNIPDRYLNIVLLGSDKRPNAGAWRTDSMIVVSVDMQDNVVRLLSIPRDLWVEIPGFGSNRINTADLLGELSKKGSGPDRVKKAIYHNLGIPIHYYVRVDFQGFIKIIDTVGGVDIDVDCPLPDIKLAAGMHHMTGQQALRYARSRYSTSDYDRGRRQRKVLLALWEQALTLDIIPKIPSLWRTMSDSYQTDLPLDQVINLAYVGVRLKPQRILSAAVGSKQVENWTTPEGAMVLVPQPDKVRALLEAFYAPRDLSKLDTVERTRVQVLTGTNRREVEQLAAAALRWGGFQVSEIGAADRSDYVQSKIVVYAGSKADGERVADLLHLPRTIVEDLSGNEELVQRTSPMDIQVILGSDYDPCFR